jgi:glycosyltransferase involved in cell wall biosynthesis
MIKVSVILPIFNVASYLDEAFDSLINQSLKEIEIIAVNDGSTDNSEEIIEKYKQKDSRIISLYQHNQGQSVARNTGLSHAKGEYIYMMDSDDSLSTPDALQICYEYAKKQKADFIFFDGEIELEDSMSPISWNYKRTHLIDEGKKYGGEYLLNKMLDNNKHNCVVWLLLINHDYLKSIGLKFHPGIIHEDELFTTILTINSSSIYGIRQSFIKHRIRISSTMGEHYSKRNIDCYLTVIDELIKWQDSSIIHRFAKYTLSKVFYTGHVIPFKDKFSVFFRAMKSGYLKFIGLKSCLVFWLKR